MVNSEKKKKKKQETEKEEKRTFRVAVEIMTREKGKESVFFIGTKKFDLSSFRSKSDRKKGVKGV